MTLALVLSKKHHFSIFIPPVRLLTMWKNSLVVDLVKVLKESTCQDLKDSNPLI